VLNNKNAFITGCNRGIGKSILRKFIKNRANVICAVRKADSKFLKFINNIKKKSKSNIKIVEFDLLNESEVKNTISSLNKKNFKIDILINNAGLASGSIFEMTSIEKIKKIFETNYFAQLRLTQLLLRFLKKSKSASIINLGSVTGIIPERGTLAYGSSKAALMFATKIMANEFSNYGIRVNAIAPSVVQTNMSDKMNAKAKEALIEQSFLKKEGSVEDISDLALFLSSENSKHINGQVIRIDGGMKI
jgi:3-oxoacyl-[acyl-carrier protein] reductase